MLMHPRLAVQKLPMSVQSLKQHGTAKVKALQGVVVFTVQAGGDPNLGFCQVGKVGKIKGEMRRFEQGSPQACGEDGGARRDAAGNLAPR